MKRIALLVLGMLIASPAAAKTWVVDYEQSRLGFTAQQGSLTFDGQFKKFDAVIGFDPSKPETGKISAMIDIASVTTNNAERDAYLPQRDWFDTKKFPQAVFTSTQIRKAAQPECFEAEGTLAIKGISRMLTLPFCLKTEGSNIHAEGAVTLMRDDYAVGVGQWAGEGLVKNGVMVKFEFVAH